MYVPPDRSKEALTRLARSLDGLVVPALDVDWLALDSQGSVAVFLGADDSPMPKRTDAEKTSLALEAITRAVARRLAATSLASGYRAAAMRAQDPIFDVPIDGAGAPVHERPFDGYPHLVIASMQGVEMVRRMLADLGGREVLAHGAFAVALDGLGRLGFAALHESKEGLERACAGCRLLDDPEDPRPRSPEALAAAGLYVYAYAPGPDAGPDMWVRVASPSVPADRDDIRELAHLAASFEELSVHFADATRLVA